MSKIHFYMANFAGFALILFMLGSMGMAEDIYPEDEFKVYDSDEDPDATGDFDLNDVRFDPDVRNPDTTDALEDDKIIDDSSTSNIISTAPYRFSWNGEDLTNEEESDFGEFEADGTNYKTSYGIQTYNISDRNDDQIINVEGDDVVFISVIEEIGDEEDVTSGPASSGSYNFDLSGEEYGFEKAEAIEIITVDEDTSFDVSGQRDYGGGVEGFANSALSLLNTSYDYIAEIPKFISAYISFAGSIPGGIGSFMRLYMGILIVVFILDQLWIG